MVHQEEEDRMREARIILPKEDNNGESLEAIKQRLAWRLAVNFGGFTLQEGQGAWISPNKRLYSEAVYIFDVAASEDWAVAVQLRSIARWLAREARQEAIYLRLPTGQVEFITP